MALRGFITVVRIEATGEHEARIYDHVIARGSRRECFAAVRPFDLEPIASLYC
jgi:hypothetical protein